MANARPPLPPVPKRPAGAAPAAGTAARPAPARPVAARAPLRPTAMARPGLATSTPTPPGRPATPVAAASQTAAAQRPLADPVIEGLLRTIVGLEAVVEEETQALQMRQPIDLDVYSNRKSQGLMELNRSMQHIEALQHRTQLAPRLDSLRTKLAANQAALKLHLEAVREISGIIANAIREQEHDGTYSHTIRRPEAAYGYD